MTLPAAYDLTGRRALVTGAAGLLGPEHAAALLELGAEVVLTDLDEQAVAKKAAALGPGASARALDVTDPAAHARLAAELEIDILVNNAAIDAKVKPVEGLEPSRFEGFDRDQWDREIAVGLTGAMLACQAFGARMAARGRGTILNIASDLSVSAPDQRLYRKEGVAEERQPVKPVTYSVIKTGLIGLTRYVAAYWAGRGVRCNALSPGGVEAGQPEAFVQRLTALIPQGRMARRDEYRAAVQFLCSDASAYMTGQNLVMDGGRSIL